MPCGHVCGPMAGAQTQPGEDGSVRPITIRSVHKYAFGAWRSTELVAPNLVRLQASGSSPWNRRRGHSCGPSGSVSQLLASRFRVQVLDSRGSDGVMFECVYQRSRGIPNEDRRVGQCGPVSGIGLLDRD
jgi:hypothetical protein